MFTKQPDEYDPKEVAAVLGVAESSVRRYISSGELRAQKRGKYLFIKKADLEQFIKDKTINK